MTRFSIKANLIDIIGRKIFPAEIAVSEGKICSVKKIDDVLSSYILPGFVDSHIHIESSMVTPLEFARVAITHGTVGTVSDPHEIANVLGIDGVKFMLKNSGYSPLKIFFGAPSCVPATDFESSGAHISAADISDLFESNLIGYLSEMMNYPGVINRDKMVMEKLSIARKLNFPIDGHAPGLRGKNLEKYVSAGISTDHECFTLEEAKEKISLGMLIQIREGSGAKNFNSLISLLNDYPENIMFCSDDLHPDDLLKGHINLLVKKAIEMGYDLFDVLKASGYNAIKHYNLDIGLLRVGDQADFIVVSSLKDFEIEKVCINGIFQLEQGKVNISRIKADTPNKFAAEELSEIDLHVKPSGAFLKVIQAIDGELITKKDLVKIKNPGENIISDIEQDHLKIIVLNRYEKTPPAVGFIKGFGLKDGAIASSIAHDSHNIICVGTSDKYIMETVNWIIRNKGGIVAYDGRIFTGLPLPVAGIMSDRSVEYAAGMYKEASLVAAKIGSKLKAPFMTLAFMSLLVIPEIKLSDKGLFDCNTFEFTPLFE